MTQPLQLSPAQLAQAEKAFKAKLDAKTLECASLEQIKKNAPAWTELLFVGVGALNEGRADEESIKALGESIGNYLTAKLNQAVIELQEMELQLKAIQSMSNRIQPAVLMGSHTQNKG